MVFGIQKLQNDVFCLTEERDYFQGKFLEQVSELTALKEELRQAKREITKLRQQLMGTSAHNLDTTSVASPRSHTLVVAEAAAPRQEEADDDDDDDASDATPQTPSRREEEDEDQEAKDIRQSAEKLLQWASYRSSVVRSSNTPTTRTVATDHSSVSSNSMPDAIDVPRTIESASLEEDDSSKHDEEENSQNSALRDTARRLLDEQFPLRVEGTC